MSLSLKDLFIWGWEKSSMRAKQHNLSKEALRPCPPKQHIMHLQKINALSRCMLWGRLLLLIIILQMIPVRKNEDAIELIFKKGYSHKAARITKKNTNWFLNSL